MRSETHKTLNVAHALRLAGITAFLSAGSAFAQDRDLFFDTTDPGVSKAIPTWGLDLAWLNENNLRRGVVFMGQPQVDVVRCSFTGDTPVSGGDLTGTGLTEFNTRLSLVDTYTDSHTEIYLNNDTDSLHASYQGAGGVNAFTWAELIKVTKEKFEANSRNVVSIAPFNEPDYATYQGNSTRLGDVCWQLRWGGAAVNLNDAGVRLYGASTLNNDQAAPWYDPVNSNGFLEEGCTHQLAGSFNNYAGFFQTVEGNGDVGSNDELHNVMEAMVGAEYGMDTGIWWGPAERARGEFVKASDGDRLAYAEHRPNWTAASVYRAPDGKVQAFVGESERQALPTTYRFVSKDRPVFYDGHGPQRVFDVTTTGGPGYMTEAHRNAERVVNITWGDDVQPVIDGRYIIVAKHSGKVLDVSGASTAGGANIQQWTYTGASHQQWDVEPVPSSTGGDYSYFTIRAAHSGQNIDLLNFSYADGGNVIQFGTGFGVNQQWFLEYAGDGYFYIRSKWSGKYLDVNGGVAATGDGANVQQWSGPGGANQLWRFMPVDADPTDATAPAQPTGLVASANAVSVDLTWNASIAADLDGYTLMRSATSGGPYEIIARGLTNNSYTDNSANQTTPYYYVVTADDHSLNRSANSAEASSTPSGAPVLVAHLGFEGNTDDDTVNANHGVVAGTASYGGGWIGTQALVLDGTNHLTLPAEVVNHDEVTVATWVRWNGGSDWQRVFDFGNGTEEYMQLTPKAGGGGLRFAIKNGGGEQQLNAPVLGIGQWVHLAVTLGPATSRLYVNGVIVDESAGVTIRPSDFNPVLNLLGDSQFTADPLFNGSIDDFRIYNHALEPAEIETLVGEAATLAHWNFEDGVAGQAFTPAGDPDGSGGSVDLDNGIVMYGFNDYFGPSFTASAPPNGDSLAMDCADSHQDAYVTEGALHGWSPTQWTIECTVRLDNLAGYRTLIGRDGSSAMNELSDFYLQNNGIDDRFRVNFGTVGGQRWILDGNYTVQAGTWYAIAARSDGSTLSLWLDDGSGYQQIGTLDISSQSVADNALPGSTSFNWTFGRGWFNGGFVDHIDGQLDNIRFSAAALAPQDLIPLHPVPEAPTGLVASAGPGGEISLSWTASDWATSYKVKRSTSSGGPYTTVATGVAGTVHDDGGLLPDTTYYYVVSAENSTGESTDSAENSDTTLTAGEEWRFSHFGFTANTGDAADGADPDGDTIDNLMERALAGDPNQPDSGILPTIDPSAPMLGMIYRKALDATDLNFGVQESPDLQVPWIPAAGSEEVISDNGVFQEIRFTRPTGGAVRLFLRLEVTTP